MLLFLVLNLVNLLQWARRRAHCPIIASRAACICALSLVVTVVNGDFLVCMFGLISDEMGHGVEGFGVMAKLQCPSSQLGQIIPSLVEAGSHPGDVTGRSWIRVAFIG